MSWDDKPDADDIRTFLRDLKAEPWLDHRQRHWPDYLFHVTDVTNATSILTRGELLSREEVGRLGLMASDNAAADIIAATGSAIRDAVRLYFRPRTPTAHNNEGLRPLHERTRGAHCPIPVMFVLKSHQILPKVGVRFSDGSLARHGQARIGDDASFLRSIPFRRVYHDRAFSDGDRDDIVFRRQAEVIVPKRLSLGTLLQGVYTRSPAELETLAAMLDRSTEGHANVYRALLHVNGRHALFFKQWTYLERVTLVGQDMSLEFNPSSRTPGPFSLSIRVFDAEEDTPLHSIELDEFRATGTMAFRLPASTPSGTLRVQIALDNAIAYDAVKVRGDGMIRPTR